MAINRSTVEIGPGASLVLLRRSPWHGPRQRMITVLVTCLACLVLANGCVPNDPSLRIMNYNIRFVADGDDVNDQEWADDEERAKFIGNKIVDTIDSIDADVIAFNEAFTIEAQRELSRILCPHYPYFVRYIDEAADDQHQDSGLMIFSRHPFADLGFASQDYYSEDHLAFTKCVDADDADEGDPSFWKEVGFILFPFESCTGDDCWANKGVAVTRFRHRTFGDGFNVVFSHMQATTSGGDMEEFRQDRREQMKLVQELVEAVPGWENQRTFVVGDLNIDGKGCSTSGCTVTGTGDEWTEHFNSGGFFACTGDSCPAGGPRFVDSWGHEMPPEDLGRSYIGANGTVLLDESEGERLDYVLHNVPSQRQMCMQHMKLIHDFADHAGTQASDHLPVLADLNFSAPHCSPLQAKPFVGPDFQHDGEIRYPRSVQWVVVHEKGTYSINANPDPEVTYEVYAATDMSSPISDYNGEQTDWGTVFKLPDPPYYIKIFSPDRAWTGDYSLSVHQHLCGKSDPCALTPGDVNGTQASWSQGAIDSYTRWFVFFTDVGETGAFPNLTFSLDGVCNSTLEMVLWDSSDNEVPWEGYEAGPVQPEVTATHSNLKQGKYLVEVSKTNQNPAGLCTAILEFYTTLTYFHPDSLTCHDETGGSGGPAEEIGHDEIWGFFDLDPGECVASTNLAAYGKLGEFDEDDSETMGLAGYGPRRFTKCIVANLLEEDDISDGADGVTFLYPTAVVNTLAVDSVNGVFQSVWNGGDYLYQMKFVLTHE